MPRSDPGSEYFNTTRLHLCCKGTSSQLGEPNEDRSFPLCADTLKQTLPWIESEYDQFRNFVSRLINQWLVFAATYSPVEFLQTLKTLPPHGPQYLYFTLQSFLDALDQITEEEQSKFIVLTIKIVDSSPIQDLARSLAPRVWDTVNSRESNRLGTVFESHYG